METYNFFVNKAGRVRSGWRVAVFFVAFMVVVTAVAAVVVLAISLVFKMREDEVLAGTTGFYVQAFILFTAATFVSWACGALFEELPLRALGWANHRGWLRDFLVGSVIGIAAMGLVVLVGVTGRGFHFAFDATRASAAAIGQSLLFSGVLFVFAASAEEALFRGYPLQTLTRARLAWLGILLTSVPFAAAHLLNPNAAGGFVGAARLALLVISLTSVPVAAAHLLTTNVAGDIVGGLTFANTVLAGVWLAVGYLRTKSLWLPLGMHWAWNWTMGSVVGLPVSGHEFTRAPVFRLTDSGPAWLTGDAYGPEGGVVCTVALMVAIAFLWRTRWLSAAEEMQRFATEDDENAPHAPAEATGESETPEPPFK